MSSNEKKIKFTGEDAGASSAAKKIFNDILASADKYTNSLKEQNSYIEKQIKALEKKHKIDYKEGKKIFEETGELYKNARTPQEKTKYANQNAQVRRELDNSSSIIEGLRSLLEEFKKQTTAAQNAEKYQHEKSRAEKEEAQGFSWVSRDGGNVGGGKKNIFTSESNSRAAQAEKVAKIQAEEDSKRKQKKEEKESITGQVFKGTFLANMLKEMFKSLGTIVGAKSGEEGLNTLLGGIPLVGGLLSGASGRNFEEQLGIQTKELELSAKTGRKIGGLSNQTRFGYSTRETLGMTEGLIGAAGNASGANQTEKGLLLQRGLGLSQDVITQIVKDLRTTRSSADIMQIASDVLAANPELRKDQTKFAEILAQTSQLTNTLASQSENVDPSRSAGIVGALRSVGGSFADSNLGSARMNSINSALTNPSTDYQKARSFGVLSKLNPGASWFKINEMMEGGVGQKGYLSGILKQFSRESGGGEENLATQIQQNLGLGFSSSRLLSKKYLKDPKFADNFSGGLADIEKDFNLSERAEKNTSGRDKERAETDNAFAISAAAGTMKIAALTFDAGATMVKEAAADISKTFATFGNQIIGKLQGKSDSVISREQANINKLYTQ